MKLPSAKYILAGSLLLSGLAAYLSGNSCGPDVALDETRFALFKNNLTNQRELEPFYYSERFMNAYEPDPAKNDYQRNCKEWQAFTGSNVRLKDINALQYATSPEDFLQAYRSNNWKPFASNSFVQWLLQKKHRSSLDYFVLAKQAEFSQFGNLDPWETGTNEQPETITVLPQQAAARLHTVLPLFLKERYAFQTIKQYYYSAKKSQAFRDSVEKWFAVYFKKSRSVVADWALLYYGLMQADKNKKITCLLQAFDRSDEKKVFIYQYLTLPDLVAFEKRSNDNKTKELAAVVKAMKNPGRAAGEIAAVYRYNPASKYLPLLITREVNKLEDWLSSWQQLGFTSATQEAVYETAQRRLHSNYNDRIPYEAVAAKNRLKDQQYLVGFLQQLQQMKKVSAGAKPFQLLAQAHLQNMNGNYTAAKQICSEIATVDKALDTQKWVEKTIVLVNTENIALPAVKEKIAAYIQTIGQLNAAMTKAAVTTREDRYTRDTESATAEEEDDLSELMLLISNCYKKRGDVVTAGLIYHSFYHLTNYYDGWVNAADSCAYGYIAYFDRYAAPEDIDQLLALKHSTGKTAFEQLIMPKHWAKDDFYKDLKGTLLFRRKRYREALATFQTMADTFWRGNYEYAAYLYRSSVKTVYPFSKTGPATSYAIESKKLITQDFVRLLDSIQTAPNAATQAQLYYQLGNAYYNTSYYGKDWMMFSYGKSANEPDLNNSGNYRWAFFQFYPNNSIYKNTYYRCSDAIAAYTKTLQLSTDKELSARCVLMLADCDTRRYEADETFAGRYWWADKRKKYTSHYIKQLQRKWAATSVFQQAVTHCPDVEAYVKSL